ncbi:hypothetical protein FRB93_000981 [Tulasnella sp. JGI-2019a]|nr:hypothetical protein FRB93_000981 [Tulasnella sp. JGI-2019a]
MCPQGHQQCFLYSGIGGFECVDIRNDPESCGGCVSGGDDDEGQDCTAIPGVNIVKCRQKKCAIESCRRGFQKAENGKSCEPILRSLSMQSRYRGYGYF